jgi:hypothetical protein
MAATPCNQLKPKLYATVNAMGLRFLPVFAMILAFMDQ